MHKRITLITAILAPMLLSVLWLGGLALADPPVPAIAGTVTGVKDDELTLKTADGNLLAIGLNEDTQYVFDDGREIWVDSVQEGMDVTVVLAEGVDPPLAATVIIQTGIQVTPTEDPYPVKFWVDGTVTAVDGDSISLDTIADGAAFELTDDTVIWREDGNEGTRDDVVAGERLAAWGYFDGEKNIAEGVQIGIYDIVDDPVHGQLTGVVLSANHGAFRISSSGFITDIATNGDTEVVEGPIFAIDPDEPTETPAEVGEPESPTIEPGQTVEVEVDYTTEQSLAVRVGIVSHEDPGYLAGGSFLGAGDGEITIDSSAGRLTLPIAPDAKVTRLSDGEEVTLASIDANAYVVLAVDSVLDPTVTGVQVADLMYESVKGNRLSGTVKSFNAKTGIAVVRSNGNGVKLHVTQGTRVAHADGSSAPVRAIRRGVFLEFDGAAAGDSIIAASIRLSDRRMEAGVLGAGKVVPAGRRFMLRAGGKQVRVIAADSTIVIKADGSRGTVADLKPGTATVIDGVGGVRRVVATRIQVLTSRAQMVRVEGSIVKATPRSLVIDRGATNTRVFLKATTLGVRGNGAPLVAGSLKAGAKVLVVGVRGNGAVARFVMLR